jgi:hypothetical protein
MMANREQYFSMSFWLVILVTTVCGFELSMVLYVIGERVSAGGYSGGPSFFFGKHAPVRDVLELASFFASVVVSIVALCALIFTVNQLKESENTRLANVYLEIMKEYMSTEVANSRRELVRLKQAYLASHLTDESKQREAVGQYIADILQAKYESHLGRVDGIPAMRF